MQLTIDEYADGSILNHTQWIRRQVIGEARIRHTMMVGEAGMMEAWWKQTQEEAVVLGAKK